MKNQELEMKSMRFMRRRMLGSVLGFAMLAGGAGLAHAQAYPTKPIWIIVPYAAGGAVDIVARSLGEDLSKRLGQQVLVDNKPGAGGNVATAHVARSAPDGYTLVIAGGATTVAKQLFANLQYDPYKDLTPVAMIGAAPAVLVVAADSPIKDVEGLVAMAKAKPGAMTFGHGGVGTTSEHLAGEMFRARADIDITTVAYKGGPAAMNDVIGGRITAVFTNPVNAIPMISSGRIRALAVAADNRLPALPEVPTMAQAGMPDFEVAVWWGLMGPANLPEAVVRTLNAAVGEALATGAIRTRLDALNAFPISATPAQFRKFFEDEGAKWVNVARQAGLKPE